MKEIRNRNQFHYWLFGHYHDNRVIDEKYVLLYEQMVRIIINRAEKDAVMATALFFCPVGHFEGGTYVI